MTVWLLFRDDGNACCPGEELVDVFANESSAKSAMDAHIARRDKGGVGDYWIVEKSVIAVEGAP